MSLEDYKDPVALCAMVFTMGHMLSGTIVCKNIYYKGTKGLDPMPFIGGIGMCLLMLRYAFIVDDQTMKNVNVFGLFTNTIYTLVFYIYSPDKIKTVTLLSKSAAVVAIFMGYAHLENAEVLEVRYGIAVTVLYMCLLASPLVNLNEIIKTKSTAALAFPLIFMQTIVTFLWLLYGYIINDSFIIVQNVVGFFLSVIQLSLFVIYPSTPVVKVSDKKKK